MSGAYLWGFKGSTGNGVVKLLKHTYRRFRRETCHTNLHGYRQKKEKKNKKTSVGRCRHVKHSRSTADTMMVLMRAACLGLALSLSRVTPLVRIFPVLLLMV